ncbi:hypothetical protein YC2023_118910 [Brassica napus]
MYGASCWGLFGVGFLICSGRARFGDLGSVCFDVGVDDLETCSILCFFSVTSSIEPCCELNSSFVRIGWRYLCFGVNASLLVDFRRSVSNSPGVGVVFIQLPAVLSRCSSYLEVIVDEFSLGNLVFGFGGLCFVHLLALGGIYYLVGSWLQTMSLL